MPLESVVILVFIVAVFATFGLVLAWGEYQTRHLPRATTSLEIPAASHPDETKLAA